MTTRQVLGIDPGLNGALAFLTPHQGVDVLDMPTVKAGKGRSVDEHALARLFDARAGDIGV